MRKVLLVIILTLSLVGESKYDNHQILYTNIIGSATIITWGVFNWDYGKRSMHTSSEGWFGKDTKNGGADKLGHFYTTFAFSHYFAYLYQGFGYTQHEASKQGAISSLLLNSVMEVGDAFSTYGFSYEDFLINALGSYLGYYLLMHPSVNEKLDIRLEYKPTKRITQGDSYDIFTDYNGMKFVAVLKFDGFEMGRNNFLKYFEFHTGYYTREKQNGIQRHPYLGIGINLSHLLRPISKKASKFFNYYQMPYSYISH
ncbi:MAG: YfiM family protein [Epsilonproteobacteria bacterium]|nr:YfiM family protein [Campylobacterota bacterium]